MHSKHPNTGRRIARASIMATLLATVLAAPAALAADVTPGTYMLEGGSYSIEIQPDGDGLVVVEPNKQSPYTRYDDDEFHFYNPNTDTNYGIRYLDERTIEAFKPDQPGNVGSRLVLMSRSGADAIVENDDSARWEALAEEYAARIESDPDNVQAWAACAGVAMKRSVSTVPDADAYAQQMAQMLQQLMPAGSPSPCGEVMAF
jgi:hypothetical protein